MQSQNSSKDLYRILGVSPNASAEQIVKAFRNLAKKHHPDINAGNSEQEFILIYEAYAILSDIDKRKTYDESLGVRRNSLDQPSRYSTSHKQPGHPVIEFIKGTILIAISFLAIMASAFAGFIVLVLPLSTILIYDFIPGIFLRVTFLVIISCIYWYWLYKFITRKKK